MNHCDFFVQTAPGFSTPVAGQIIGYWLDTETNTVKEVQEDGQWHVVYTLCPVDHTHDDLTDIVTLLSSGITGTKTIGNYQFTFTHGVLTGFQAV